MVYFFYWFWIFAQNTSNLVNQLIFLQLSLTKVINVQLVATTDRGRLWGPLVIWFFIVKNIWWMIWHDTALIFLYFVALYLFFGGNLGYINLHNLLNILFIDDLLFWWLFIILFYFLLQLFFWFLFRFLLLLLLS